MILFGVLAIVAGIVMLFYRRNVKGELLEIKFLRTSKVSDIVSMAEDVRDELGQVGAYSALVELKGVCRASEPLISDFAKERCVQFRSAVLREYEETYYETDPQTKHREKRVRRASETISENTRSIEFSLEDETGSISVAPDGADMSMIKVFDKFESGHTPTGRIDGAVLPFRAQGDYFEREGSRTLGYVYEEYIFPVNRNIYIIGNATDVSGKVRISKPTEAEKPFIISLKSEEELVRGKQGQISFLLWGSIIAILVGIGALFAGILGTM